MSKTDRTAEVLEATLAPIIASIEAGIANPGDWVAPWHRASADVWTPHCPATGRNYTAGNRFMLAIASMFFGAEPHWGTFNQWKSLSKHTTECNKTASAVGTRNEKRPDCSDDCQLVSVSKGSKSIAYALRPLMRKEVNDAGVESMRLFGFSPFAVFHSGQVDGYEIPVSAVTATADADDVAGAFDFAKLVGASVTESNYEGAFYRPLGDIITMPARDRWKDAIGAWSTMAHELTHWTGHSTRLNRDLTGRFGSDSYAAEELVAELGSAFALATLGRSAEPREDHAQYLAHWLRVLKADPKHLMTVASHAEKAAAFITAAAAVETVVEAAPEIMMAAA